MMPGWQVFFAGNFQLAKADYGVYGIIDPCILAMEKVVLQMGPAKNDFVPCD
jgi:hypothetical protein